MKFGFLTQLYVIDEIQASFFTSKGIRNIIVETIITSTQLYIVQIFSWRTGLHKLVDSPV